MKREADAIITVPVEYMRQMVAENKPVVIVQTVGKVDGKNVKTGFEAAREVKILRREIIKQEPK
jgi:sRNA-binding carbon storage regulator CsrA